MGNSILKKGIKSKVTESIVVTYDLSKKDEYVVTLRRQTICAFEFIESYVKNYNLRFINSYLLFNFFTEVELFLKSIILIQANDISTFSHANSYISKYQHNLSSLIDNIDWEIIEINQWRQFISTFKEIFKLRGYWSQLYNYTYLRYGLSMLKNDFFSGIELSVNELIELGRKMCYEINR